MASRTNPNKEQPGKLPFLFHKDLAALGPVRLTVDGEVRELKRTGKPTALLVDVTLLQKGKAAQPFSLWCEHTGIADFFGAAEKGVPFTVIAEGARDTATVVDVGRTAEAAKPAPPPPPPVPPEAAPHAVAAKAHGAATRTTPTPHDTAKAAADAKGDKATHEARVFLARRVSLKRLCVKAVLAFDAECQAHGAPKMPPESFWSQVTNFYISVESEGLAMRKGFADNLPAGLTFARLEELSQRKAAQPATEPAPQPKPEPAADNGEAF